MGLMSVKKSSKKPFEKGNVLFYILIAVAMIAALSYAVAQSGRGNIQKLKEEKAGILAQEILDYTNTLSSAVTQIKLRGVKDSELCFDDANWPGSVDYNHAGCTDNFNHVFHIEGAGLTLNFPPNEAMNESASPDDLWHFTGATEIQNVGSTCNGDNCTDLIVTVDELNKETCLAINDMIGMNNPSDNPPVDSTYDNTEYQGSFGYVETVGNEAGGTDLIGASSGCFYASALAKYVFYKVLVAR